MYSHRYEPGLSNRGHNISENKIIKSNDIDEDNKIIQENSTNISINTKDAEEDDSEYATREDFYGDFHIASIEYAEGGEKKPQETGIYERFSDLIKRSKRELEELENTIVNMPRSGGYYEDTDIFSTNEKIKPFGEDGVEWVKIDKDELWTMSFIDRGLIKEPLLIYGNMKYRHLALGRTDNGYMLGIPDTFKARERFVNGHKVFDKFVSSDGNEPKNGSYGYWVKRINASNN